VLKGISVLGSPGEPHEKGQNAETEPGVRLQM
jgi:hypothetical protein